MSLSEESKFPVPDDPYYQIGKLQTNLISAILLIKRCVSYPDTAQAACVDWLELHEDIERELLGEPQN